MWTACSPAASTPWKPDRGPPMEDTVDNAVVSQAAHMLRQSRQPMAIVGSQALLHTGQVEALAGALERIGLPPLSHRHGPGSHGPPPPSGVSSPAPPGPQRGGSGPHGRHALRLSPGLRPQHQPPGNPDRDQPQPSRFEAQPPPATGRRGGSRPIPAIPGGDGALYRRALGGLAGNPAGPGRCPRGRHPIPGSGARRRRQSLAVFTNPGRLSGRPGRCSWPTAAIS